MECIKNDIKNIIEDIVENKKNETEKMSKEEEVEYYDNLIEKIEKGFTENYDTSNLDNGQDEVINTEKMTVTFTTPQNQRNNINNNMTAIDLGECESLLRIEYNISPNETLYMKKMDIVQEGMKTPKVEYDVYCKLFGTNLIKLNLTVCANSKVSIYTPIKITENLDKYNSSSGYYNDICYTTTSEDGTDIPLADRQANYINQDKIVCQEDCQFADYDYTLSVATCSCDVKESSKSMADMNVDKEKILDNFINFKNIVNFNFLVCAQNLFSKKSIEKNIGSYLIFAIIFFHIMTLFIFYLNQYHSLNKKIDNIGKIFLGTINKEKRVTNEAPINNLFTSKDTFIKKRKRKIKRKTKRKNWIGDSNKNKKINKIIMEYKDEEINSLPYNLAINYDKRTYCEIYASLIKTKHNFINSFIYSNDYNSKIIKIDIFFIGFAIESSVNGLFYNDDTMHKIYKSSGAFDLKTQLPIIIYSYLISLVLNEPLNRFGLSNDDITGLKQNLKITNFKKGIKSLKKRLSIKFILFFIIGFILLGFLWYYISLFCVVYKNTQIHLIYDTLMGFGLSMLFPFGIYLIPAIFRMIALSDKKHKRKFLYDFSKIFQFF